jgi:hypothetical protein
MVKLVKSEVLGRIIRMDPVEELGISTFSRIKEALEAGRKEEASTLVDYLVPEGKRLHDVMCDWVYGLFNYLAETFGEEEVYKAQRNTAFLLKGGFSANAARMSLHEYLAYQSESMRSHRCGPGEIGNYKIREEKDRYVMAFDPCGSGGRIRRGSPIDHTPPRTGPPYNLGRTTKPYPWSWGKAGVPYYCTHCCIMSEIIPIENQGYPLRLCEYSDNPQDPCIWIFYKDPNLIPEKYFTRVGKKKDPAKFKKPAQKAEK